MKTKRTTQQRQQRTAARRNAKPKQSQNAKPRLGSYPDGKDRNAKDWDPTPIDRLRSSWALGIAR